MEYKILPINQNVEKELNEFITDLQKASQSKVVRVMEFLRKYGPTLSMPYSKKLEKGLYELRTKGVEKIRILYTFRNEVIYLLHIFKKKSQKTPLKDLEKARKLLTKI